MSKARQLADLGNVYDDGALSNRNLIINGAMTVAQRGTSATGLTNTNSGYKALDRWNYVADNSLGQLVTKMEQVSDAPNDFVSSLKITVTTAETAIAGDEHFGVHQPIEAQDLQHLNYGTSSAKQLTVSFWVKSSIATTFAVGLYKTDTTSSMIAKTYTVNTANTWEYKTITYDGLQGSGIDNNTSEGLRLWYHLAVGPDRTDSTITSWQTYDGDFSPVQFAGIGETLNATWQITGVQLEVGDTATPFEHRSYGDELARCQRYCQLYGEDTTVAGVVYNNDKDHYYPFRFPEMRARPSVTFSDQPTIFANATNGQHTVTAGGVNNDNRRSIRFQAQNINIGSSGQAAWFQNSASDSYFLLEAEL